MKTGARTYSSAIERADNYTRWVLSTFAGHFGRSILEVGLGHGTYRRFLPVGTQYTGLDIDAGCVEMARQRYPGDHFIVGDITSIEFGSLIRHRHIDTILCVNVLEHVRDDANAMRNMLDCLPEGGKLLLFVPAFRFLYNEMDRLAGHERRYRLRDIDGLLPGNARFLLRRYFNAVGAVGWWANSFKRHHSLDSESVNAQIEVFDRYVVPLARAVDRFTHRIIGQSAVCVIQRNGIHSHSSL